MQSHTPAQQVIETKFKKYKYAKLCMGVIPFFVVGYILFALFYMIKKEDLVMCIWQLAIGLLWAISYVFLKKAMVPSFIITDDNLIVTRASSEKSKIIPWNDIAGMEKALFETTVQLRSRNAIKISNDKFATEDLAILTDAVQQAISSTTEIAAAPDKK